jgi:hypothetical protein
MTTAQYSSSSAYYTTPIDSNGIMGIWTPRYVPASTSDKLVTISHAYNLRPDLMAFDLYGDSNLWWVFAQRNPNVLASDPLGNFTAGSQIFIPDATALKSALGV